MQRMFRNSFRLALCFIIVINTYFCNSANENEQKTEQETRENNGHTSDNLTKTKIKPTKRLYSKFKVRKYCKSEDQDTVYYYMGKFGATTPFEISVKRQKNELQVKYRIIDDAV